MKDEPTEEDLREPEEERQARLKEEAESRRASDKWGWFTFVYMLADGDPTKFEAVMLMNMNFALTFQSFRLENKKFVEALKQR